MEFFRKAWRTMDLFDRVVCVIVSAVGLFGCLAFVFFGPRPSWPELILIVAVSIALGFSPWTMIPKQSREARILRSICADTYGPRGLFCVLEPGHRGDHKHFLSNGGMIGWPNKGGA